jgi:hypothetical protein
MISDQMWGTDERCNSFYNDWMCYLKDQGSLSFLDGLEQRVEVRLKTEFIMLSYICIIAQDCQATSVKSSLVESFPEPEIAYLSGAFFCCLILINEIL